MKVSIFIFHGMLEILFTNDEIDTPQKSDTQWSMVTRKELFVRDLFCVQEISKEKLFSVDEDENVDCEVLIEEKVKTS